MKPIKNIGFNLSPSGNGWWLSFMLLMFFSVNSFAQLHVSENTVLSVAENTILYVADEAPKTTATIQKENRAERSKEIAKQQKKINIPSQPPIVKEDTEPETGTSVLFFTSIPKAPSALFYSWKIIKAAIVNAVSFPVKIIPLKKSNNNINQLFLLSDDKSHSKISFAEMLLKQQKYLKEYITRPPPYLS